MIPMLIPAVRQILFGQSLEKKVQAIVRRNGIAMYVPIPGVTCFQDSACTIPAVVDDPVGGLKDYLGLYPATQATSGYRPILRGKVKNWLLNSATLSTQSVSLAVSSITWTLSFEGTGTVTLSGGYAGSLVGTGVSDRVSLTFTTTTATNVTYTVSGSVTNAQIELGSVANPYVPTTSAPASSTYGPYWLNFDGVDDTLSSANWANVSPAGGNPSVTIFSGIHFGSVNADFIMWGASMVDGLRGIGFTSTTLRTASSSDYAASPALLGRTPFVLAEHMKNATSVDLRYNGSVYGSSTGLTTENTPSSKPLYLGSRLGVGQRANILMNCAIVSPINLSVRDIYLLEKYAGKLAGISI